MIETSARPRSRTHRADSPHRHRTVSAQRAIDRRNRRLARTMQIATGAAVRNGGLLFLQQKHEVVVVHPLKRALISRA